MNKAEYDYMNTVEDDHWWFLGKKQFLLEALKPFLHKKQEILDVGSGTGGMTMFLRKLGKVVGLEHNVHAMALARNKKIKVYQGSGNKLPFANNQFTLVTFFDVLYHKKITEEKALSEAWRVLKKDGYVVITDCALPFFWSSHDVAMHAKKRFTKTELETLVRNAGFTVMRSSYIFFFTFPLFIIDRLISKVRVKENQVSRPPLLINTILTVLITIEAALFKFTNFPIGSSIIVLARKE